MVSVAVRESVVAAESLTLSVVPTGAFFFLAAAAATSAVGFLPARKRLAVSLSFSRVIGPPGLPPVFPPPLDPPPPDPPPPVPGSGPEPPGSGVPGELVVKVRSDPVADPTTLLARTR